MRIAVDGMGGDFAPEEVVKGAVMAAKEDGVSILLVGLKDRMEAELAKYDLSGADIRVVPATQFFVEGEHPAYALRKKPDASIVVATGLVKKGLADAVVSAGPTGGVVACAMMLLGMLEGISRPVVGGAFLGFAPKTVMMDLGGNVDCQPYQLLDFGVVGTVIARKMLGVENPTVAILSNGAEEGKGNNMVKETYPLLKTSGLNFIGSVEGYDIPSGKANVILCDGFVGNIMVKFCESLGKSVSDWMGEKLKGRLPADEVQKMARELIVATNIAEVRGGGPLLAVNGVACVAHGRCKAGEIRGVIGQAKLAVEQDLVGALKIELAAARARLKETRPQ